MKLTAIDIPLALELGNGDPQRVQVVHGLRVAVQNRPLPAGSELQSTRLLAADLGNSRGLVVEAEEPSDVKDVPPLADESVKTAEGDASKQLSNASDGFVAEKSDSDSK